MLTIHLEHEGKSARLGLSAPMAERIAAPLEQVTSAGKLTRVQALNGQVWLPGTDAKQLMEGKPGFIVELEAEDVLPADDEASGQQVFGWNNSRWSFDGLAACPRLLLPTYGRLRPDKEFSAQSVRLTQLTSREIVSPELINRNLPALEVVRREVYAKEVKGALAVRKLVVGRRPTAAGAFPYVVFWTDFSAGRKTPLEVTTLFAHTETRAEALVKKLLEENVTKGFVRADQPKSVPEVRRGRP